MAEKKRYASIERRKVVVEFNIKGARGPDFPADHKSETLEDQMDRWFRKRMREGGQR